MDDYKHINEDDFLIRVRPFRDSTGKWTGDIDLSIVTLPDNDMDDDDYSQIIHMCTMVASTVPLMENDEALRNMIHEYVEEMFDTEYEPVLESKKTDVVVEQEGNVLTIDFNSKTKGSA